MADPKGPETDKQASGSSARPRPQTLDLSATDVTPKTAKDAGKDAGKDTPPDPRKPDSSPAAASAKPEPAKPASAADAAKSEPVKPEPAKADAAKPAAPASSGAQPRSGLEAAAATAPAAAAKASVGDKPASTTGAASSASSAAASSAPKPGAGPTAASSATSDIKLKDALPREAKPDPLAPPPKDAPREAPKPAPAQASGSVGVIGLVVAAIGGAALALAGVSLFGAKLIGAGQPGDGARVSALEAKLDGVGRDVAALRQSSGNTAQTSDTGAIEGRITELGKTIEASNARIGAVEGELKGVSEKVSQPAVVDPAALSIFATRIEALEGRMQTVPSIDTIAQVSGRVDEAEAKLKEAPTAQQLAALSQKVDGVGAAVQSAVKPLADRVAAAESALKARPLGDPTARQVVALGALGQALDAGRSFGPELRAVQASSQNAELSGLQPYAEAGVPTRAALSAELSKIMAGLPAEKAAEGGSVFSRFVANAGGLVKVTPKEAGSSTTADPRARVAALAAAGDVEQAMAAREALDPAAKQATEDWAKKATARVGAEAALNGALTAALARLGAGE